MPGPGSRAVPKAGRQRLTASQVRTIRAQVFDRDNGRCRCCLRRRATSLHELRPRSLGGHRSTENSVALCGSGTTGCHGLLQRHEIEPVGPSFDGRVDANGPIWFTPRTDQARRWLGVSP